MDVNEKSLSEQSERVQQVEEQNVAVEWEPSNQLADTQQNIESRPRQNGRFISRKDMDRPANVKSLSSEQSNQLAAIPKNKKGKFISLKNQARLANLFRKKTVDTDATPATKIESTEPPEPPEPWDISRLRSKGRELVRSRMKAGVQYELKVKAKTDRQLKVKKNAGRRLQQDGSKFSENSTKDGKEKSSVGTMKVEIENSQFTIHEVLSTEVKLGEEKQQFGMDVTVKNCRPIRRRKYNYQRAAKAKHRKAARARKLANETEEERLASIERRRMEVRRRRETETEEERLMRLERYRMSKFKRRVMETEEQRSKRLEHNRTTSRTRYWREKAKAGFCVKDTKKRQVDKKASTGKLYHENGNEDIPTEWSTQTATQRSPSSKRTESDAMCNLMHSICTNQHSHPHPQKHQRREIFDNLCTSRSSQYILSTVIWHKLHRRTK